MTLWRLWQVDAAGQLLSPFASLSPDVRYQAPWPTARPTEAWCDEHADPPAEDCECGLRGLPSAQDALTSAAVAGWLDLDSWRVPVPLSTVLVFAIGGVTLGGRRAGPSPADPSCVVRGQYATPTGRLYLSSNATPDRRTALQRHYNLPVRGLGELVFLAARGWDRPRRPPRRPPRRQPRRRRTA